MEVYSFFFIISFLVFLQPRTLYTHCEGSMRGFILLGLFVLFSVIPTINSQTKCSPQIAAFVQILCRPRSNYRQVILQMRVKNKLLFLVWWHERLELVRLCLICFLESCPSNLLDQLCNYTYWQQNAFSKPGLIWGTELQKVFMT